MKIWLNDRKISYADHFILCTECVLMRERGYPLRMECLAKTFNLHKEDHFCSQGYQYENKV